MNKQVLVTKKRLSLRSFITIIISLIVAITLLFSILLFYSKTSAILRDNSQQSITAQLHQVNQQISEQIDAIDSIIPMYLSNTFIYNTLETAVYHEISTEIKISIEKQMSYTYYSTSLSSKNYVDSIHIFSDDGTEFSIPTSGSSTSIPDQNERILGSIDKSQPQLICQTLYPNYKRIFFARNIFSSSTGKHIGTFIVIIDPQKWIDFCSKGLDPSWFIHLYSSEMNVLSNKEMKKQGKELASQIKPQDNSISFQELTLCEEQYFVAAQALSAIDITSAVAAPKDLLLRDLNSTLKSYSFLLAVVVLTALIAAVAISRAVTRPIEKIIYHINQISGGNQSSLPPMKMYQEFQIWADSFNLMLQKLDASYNDNFQKQLLLKSAEIQALQAQMDPHFLFNVLNTIAWKAQMCNNEEIYDMVISLGELLKINTFSKESALIELEQEVKYVKFYIYLQQMRFEDKISCSIQIPASLMHHKIPCFCIQPLVENAIVHGLEPKKGKGKLSINIIETTDYMEISINDNGIGFESIPDIQNIAASSTDKHTHIGLKNLDKRLTLLFGSDARLHISSTLNLCTSIFFRIPLKTTQSPQADAVT